MNVKYIILLLAGFLFCGTVKGFAQSQTTTIQGTVTDARTGKPMIGVNILVVGTTTGTVTNIDGHYSLEVSSLQDTLRFSYIGYKSKTVAIDGRTTINIQLNSKVIAGQQLVVLGYSKKKKRNLSSSISYIGGEELKEINRSNLVLGLQGLTPGLIITDHGGAPGQKIHPLGLGVLLL